MKPDTATRLLETARELRYQPANGRYARKWEQIRRLERMAYQARRRGRKTPTVEHFEF